MSKGEITIGSIRALQKEASNFWMELSSGRIVQIYSVASVATTEEGVGILWERGAFEVIAADQIIAVGKGMHAETEERIKKRMAEWREMEAK